MRKKSRENDFRKWLIGQIKIKGLYFKDDAISSGAMLLDLSTETVSRYLKKMTSSQGELKIVRGYNFREKWVATKNFPYDRLPRTPGFSLDQLCEIQKSLAFKKYLDD